MAKRPTHERTEHDAALGQIAKTDFGGHDRTVHTNPGSEENFPVDDAYPDIVEVHTPTSLISAIAEVETQSSVNELEAKEQWEKDAALGTRFYLYVPDTSCVAAKALCEKYGIHPAGIRGYVLVGHIISTFDC